MLVTRGSKIIYSSTRNAKSSCLPNPDGKGRGNLGLSDVVRAVWGCEYLVLSFKVGFACERLDINVCKMKISGFTAQLFAIIPVLWKREGWSSRSRWIECVQGHSLHWQSSLALLFCPAIPCASSALFMRIHSALKSKLKIPWFRGKKIQITNAEHFQGFPTLP